VSRLPNRGLFGNPALLGAAIVNAPITACYGAFLVLTKTGDPVAWGLLLLSVVLVNMLASVGAEIAHAIRSVRS
jgi:hypothetical protein